MGRGILTDLAIKLSSDVAELKTGLNDANKRLGKYNTNLSSAAKLIPAAFASGAVAAMITQAGRASLELLEMKSNIRQFVGEAGNIDVVTGRLKAMSKVFDVDINQSLEASNVLVKQLGVSWNRSMELIEQGLALSGAKRQEFLEQLKEYSPFFQEAKADAEDLFGVILRGFKGGVFNDKAADSIKEGILSLREMTTATKVAINSLGLDATKISESIQKGTLSIWDALGQISTRMSELPPDSKAVGTAMADIFKGAGEDAGYQFLTSFNKEFSIKDAIAGDELAQAKLRLQEEAGKIATIWSNALGKDSAWWQNFKADVLGLGGEMIKGLAAALGQYDLLGKIAGLEIISKEGTEEGITASLKFLQKKITDTRRELKEGGKGTTVLGVTFGGNSQAEQAALQQQLDGYIERYKSYQKKLEELKRKGAEGATPTASTSVSAQEILPLAKIGQTELDKAGIRIGEVLAETSKKAFERDWKKGGYLFSATSYWLETIPEPKFNEESLEYWTVLNQRMQATQGVANSLTGIFAALGNSLDVLTNKEANSAAKIGATATLISSLVTQYIALMAAKAAAGEAGKGFPANIAFTAAGVAGIMAVISPFIKKRAVGGSTSGLTLVGERGPELFDGSGYVYNSHRTKQMLGGGGGANGTVVFRISGSELVGVLKKNKLEYDQFA